MKETDQELLELAAKASGRTITCKFSLIYELFNNDWYKCNWNPLLNDKDALQLMVDLNIAVTQYPIYTSPKHSVIAKVPSLDVPRAEALELHGEDKLQATRRAIVRCAAEIGRMMKE